MKNIIYSICLICILSCSKKSPTTNDKLIDKFPSEVILKGTVLQIPPILFKPSSMCILDSFLIVTQDRSDTIFSIFKLPNCEYLLSFGNEGRGPTEFFNMNEYTTFGAVYQENNSFAVANLMTRVQYYRIIDVINHNFSPYKIVRLSPNLNRFISLVYVGDSLVFGAPYGGNMHLFKFDTFTNVLESFKPYTKDYPLFDISSMRHLYGCSIAVKPDNSKLVVSYSLQGKIEIYDLNTNKQITLLYQEFPSFEKNLGINKTSKYWNIKPEMQMFSEKVTCTNKYIYARIANDKYSTIYDAKGPNHNFIPELYIFDWLGNPIVKCKLDKYYSHYYAIDAANRFLYTLDDNIENIIRRYDLTSVLPGQN